MTTQEYMTIDAILADPTLSDDDIVKCDGDPNYRKTVGELRALEGRRHSAADQQHIDNAEAHARATLDHLHELGVSKVDDKEARAAQRGGNGQKTYPPPNPYSEHALSSLRTASVPSFEDDYKAQRLRSLEAEAARRDEHVAAYNAKHPRRLTTAEVHANYAPPDPYREALKEHR